MRKKTFAAVGVLGSETSRRSTTAAHSAGGILRTRANHAAARSSAETGFERRCVADDIREAGCWSWDSRQLQSQSSDHRGAAERARADGVRELNEARWCDALANALSDCGHAQWVSGLEHESFSQWRWQWPLACVLKLPSLRWILA